MLLQFVKENKKDLENIALAVRLLAMDAVLKSRSGHVGLPLGGAEIGTLLYFGVLHYSRENPTWVDRDRFVLSAGHGSMLQYALLHLADFNLGKEEIINFRQLHSATPGHPEYGHTLGVECTTGPLGQGIAHAVGMAIGERMLAARFGSLFDHKTYVLVGDGCLMEGVSGEASSLAGHLKLNRLITFYDANNITIDGTISIAFTENVAKRYEAYGWHVCFADANDFESLALALDQAHAQADLPQGEGCPTMIICRGVAGKGALQWEGNPKIHGNPMSADDVSAAKKHLGVLETESFFVPDFSILSAKKLGALRQKKHQQWNPICDAALSHWRAHDVPKWQLWEQFFGLQKQDASEQQILDKVKQPSLSTRSAGHHALQALASKYPNLVGGSADLAGSNLTTIQGSSFITAKDFSGRNIHFGVREHAMAAICNGITLHGGLRAYCGTFAVFSDYMRPAIRLAALMKTPTIFVLTHDSFAVGEDGPTHQPVEHHVALRVIPDLNVFRPADGLETWAAWVQAVESALPSALLLTRQDVPNLDIKYQLSREMSLLQMGMQRGGYLLKEFHDATIPTKIVLAASGSEVDIALGAALLLEKQTYATLQGEKVPLTVRVVSVPAPQRLAQEPLSLNALLPVEYRLFAIEAGVTLSFAELVGRRGAVFGLNRFGLSAPYPILAEYFGFTPKGYLAFILNQMGLR